MTKARGVGVGNDNNDNDDDNNTNDDDDDDADHDKGDRCQFKQVQPPLPFLLVLQSACFPNISAVKYI